VDAVRRLGFVDVVAVAGSSEDSARAKAAALGAPKAYGSFEALIADPDVQVVHNATPNYLHARVNAAVIAAGKHIISDKPLAMSGAEARDLLDRARAAGVVHAVTFNYRGNPLVQQARDLIARGEIGRPHFVHGAYLQDWLLFDTDYSWRLEPDKGGPTSALGDVGSHWCDLAEHVTGLRITEVLADVTTTIKTRRKPARTETFQSSANAQTTPVDITVEGSGVRASALRQRRALGAFRSARCAPATRTTCRSRCAAAAARSGGVRNSRTSCGSAGVMRPTACCRRTRRSVGEVARRVRASARRTSGKLGRRVLQCDARHLRCHRRGTRHVARVAAGVRDVCRWLSRELPGGCDARERDARQCVGARARRLTIPGLATS
jgi:predicted dehydrogenase